MKQFILICLVSGFIFPAAARGEDLTLLLTLKAEINDVPIKNELRLGLWQEGKDGIDSLDVRAMVNGSFDAYFEIPSKVEGSPHFLWWDIRSSNPSQEWKLHVNFPPGVPLVMDWKRIGLGEGSHTGLLVFIDPDTGHETHFNQDSGSLQLSPQGPKTYIIKTLLK